jgi:hypothetical protein
MQNNPQFSGDHTFPPGRPPIRQTSRPNQTFAINTAFAAWHQPPSDEPINLAASSEALHKLLHTQPMAAAPISMQQLKQFIEMDPASVICDQSLFADPEHEVHTIDCSGDYSPDPQKNCTHMGCTARTLRQRRLGRAVTSRGRHSVCSSRRNRDAPAAAHTWAARRAPPASSDWGGRSRRLGGTACASPAAIATRHLRHTHGPHGAHLRQRRLGREVASRGLHRACSSRRDRDAQPAAHTWAAWRAPSASAGLQ